MSVGQHQSARAGCVDDQRGRVRIDHVADGEDVQVLPGRGAQCGAHGGDVGSHLALHDDAPPVLQQVFDRVLDRDQPDRPLSHQVVQQGGHGRRSPAGGAAGDDDQAAARLGQPAHLGRQPQGLQRRRLGGDEAQRQPSPARWWNTWTRAARRCWWRWPGRPHPSVPAARGGGRSAANAPGSAGTRATAGARR